VSDPTEPLEFTGERFTPECVREIWYEHWHRYVFARQFAKGKRVLDAACGEGYGSALIAGVADRVLGVDIAESAIAHARTRYGAQPNLRFERADCTQLDVPAASFDLIVSFETLEHVHAQEQLLAGFARALAPGGMLLVSSPDKHTYSDISGFRNEFHVRELYRDELLALLRGHFPHVRLYGQKLLFQWRSGGSTRRRRVSPLQRCPRMPCRCTPNWRMRRCTTSRCARVSRCPQRCCRTWHCSAIAKKAFISTTMAKYTRTWPPAGASPSWKLK